MPEEYQVWLTKVQEAEKRQAEIALQQQQSVALAAQATAAELKPNHNHNGGKNNNGSSSSSHSKSEKNNNKAQASVSSYIKEEVALPEYATAADAMAAFKNLLLENEISSSMNFKSVQDVVGRDVRWHALRTVGEKKQALTEYQV